MSLRVRANRHTLESSCNRLVCKKPKIVGKVSLISWLAILSIRLIPSKAMSLVQATYCLILVAPVALQSTAPSVAAFLLDRLAGLVATSAFGIGI